MTETRPWVTGTSSVRLLSAEVSGERGGNPLAHVRFIVRLRGRSRSRGQLCLAGVDPADYIDADDLGLLGDEFTIELHAVEPRIDPPPDNPHIADVVSWPTPAT